MAAARYEDVWRLARDLTPDDRLRLIAELALLSRPSSDAPPSRQGWLDLLGSAPYPAVGDDAQAWVTRTRDESDVARAFDDRRP